MHAVVWNARKGEAEAEAAATPDHAAAGANSADAAPVANAADRTVRNMAGDE